MLTDICEGGERKVVENVSRRGCREEETTAARRRFTNCLNQDESGKACDVRERRRRQAGRKAEKRV